MTPENAQRAKEIVAKLRQTAAAKDPAVLAEIVATEEEIKKALSPQEPEESFGRKALNFANSTLQGAAEFMPGVVPIGELMGEVVDKYSTPTRKALGLPLMGSSEKVHGASPYPRVSSTLGQIGGMVLSLPKTAGQAAVNVADRAVGLAGRAAGSVREMFRVANKPAEAVYKTTLDAASHYLPRSPFAQQMIAGPVSGGIVGGVDAISRGEDPAHGAKMGALMSVPYAVAGGSLARAENVNDPKSVTAMKYREASESGMYDPTNTSNADAQTYAKLGPSKKAKETFDAKLKEAKDIYDAQVQAAKNPAEIVKVKSDYEKAKRQLADQERLASNQLDDKLMSYKDNRKNKIQSDEQSAISRADAGRGAVAGQVEAEYRGINEGRIKEAGDAMERAGLEYAATPEAKSPVEAADLLLAIEKAVPVISKTGKPADPALARIAEYLKETLLGVKPGKGGQKPGVDSAPGKTAPSDLTPDDLAKMEANKSPGAKDNRATSKLPAVTDEDIAALKKRQEDAANMAKDTTPVEWTAEDVAKYVDKSLDPKATQELPSVPDVTTNFHDLYNAYNYVKRVADTGTPEQQYAAGKFIEAIKAKMFEAEPGGTFKKAFEGFRDTSSDIEAKNRLVYNQGDKSPDATPNKEVQGAKYFSQYADSTPENIHKPGRADVLTSGEAGEKYAPLLSKIDIAREMHNRSVSSAKDKSKSTLSRVGKVETRVKRAAENENIKTRRALEDRADSVIGMKQSGIDKRVARAESSKRDGLSALEAEAKKFVDAKMAQEASTIGGNDHLVVNPSMNPSKFIHPRTVIGGIQQAVRSGVATHGFSTKNAMPLVINPVSQKMLSDEEGSLIPESISSTAGKARDALSNNRVTKWLSEFFASISPEKRAELQRTLEKNNQTLEDLAKKVSEASIERGE
jgi:hypothetical protein